VIRIGIFDLEPYFKTRLGRLYCGDAWELLRGIKDKSIDLVILDPPYVELKDLRARDERWSVRHNWNALFYQVHRVAKDNAPVFLFGLPSYFLEIAQWILKYFRIYFDLIWIKPQGLNYLKAKERPLNRHEQILCLVKHEAKVKEMTYNYRDIGTYEKPTMRIRNEFDPYQGVKRRDYINPTGFRYPTTVIEAPSKPTMKKEERTPHPTQKPKVLLEFLIKGWSNEGDLVLDPFAGSGTTLVVAERLNRKWIGIEINPEYCEIIKKRFENELGGLIYSNRLF